jgi:hypothetical protein
MAALCQSKFSFRDPVVDPNYKIEVMSEKLNDMLDCVDALV